MQRSLASALLAAAALAFGLGAAPSALASDAHCHAIKQADSRNYCLATVHGKESYCQAIGQPDGRSLCLARVKKQKSHCFAIKSADLRNQCLAPFK